MNKENVGAAALRRSAIAERLKLREEWSALKGNTKQTQCNKKVLTKKTYNVRTARQLNKEMQKPAVLSQTDTSEALRGVVAYVEVGTESRALALRAALTAMGATIVPSWSPLVTHLIWTDGGCRKIRARARALACQLVSPLWVEACASAAKRLPERLFPAPTRPSDLPSPATLRQLLKKAEHENMPLVDSRSQRSDDDNQRLPRLRISSETEDSRGQSRNKSDKSSRDQSRDTLKDQSCVISKNNDTVIPGQPQTDLMTRQMASSPAKYKRKLFTHKEAEVVTDDKGQTPTPEQPRRFQPVTPRQRRYFAAAEKIARKLIKTPIKTNANRKTRNGQNQTAIHRIVLTGMAGSERRKVCEAIRQLKGKIQSHVNKKTTHVLLGSCKDDNQNISREANEHINEQLLTDDREIVSQTNLFADTRAGQSIPNPKPRTVNALLGAVRGCRILNAQWALDSAEESCWLPHFGYEIPHLLKTSQIARAERSALGRMRSEYVYEVFYGIHINVRENAPHREAIKQLLTLCGGQIGTDCDITIGTAEGEIDSKWVFDSIAAARLRTTRRYVNRIIPSNVVDLTRY
ncbi:unnamed protein product [Leptosia nina]|uniref:BRCT domain-containing protein n=1 Tax=Leptosia nina TaxID=320188 RepID=A0AAV1J7T5_9NEOP